MASLGDLSPGPSSLSSSPSYHSVRNMPISPPLSDAGGSASSSSVSLANDDEENHTITAHSMWKRSGKQKSQEDLRLLAISTHITELSYSISDIQARIFEIQELRHKSQSSGDASSTTAIIDQSLLNLDERLESVSKGVKAVNDSLEPIVQSLKIQTPPQDVEPMEENLLLRKHETMLTEWEAVQKESEVLREELKEDKWLTVFRTVTEQADGMMSSLEKAVNRCQDFMFQLQRRGLDDSSSQASSASSVRSENSPLNADVFGSLMDSYEAKKKHYMPATAKVLSIIDKGVQDRVTKNGECLRRHAESSHRWRNLKDRIARTDIEMENMRKLILDVSEAGSSTGQVVGNGYLATPPTGLRKSKSPTSSPKLSMSTFRKMANRLTGQSKSSRAATPVGMRKTPSKTPSSEQVPTLRHRTSMFHFKLSQPSTPITPERPNHKYSQSLTPESSPSSRKTDLNATLKSRPTWNSSTKVEAEVRPSLARSRNQRPPSSVGFFQYSDDLPPVPTMGTYKRSLSRSSMASSRPWSPVTSSVSTTATSNPPFSTYRPPSRAQTPSSSVVLSPRLRPKTPSQIPAPSKSHWRSMSTTPSDNGWDDEGPTSLMQRTFSPTRSSNGGHPRSPSAAGFLPPRPPSRSMIPVPSVQISTPSRPGSAMSESRPGSSMSFRGSIMRTHTPDGSARSGPQRPKLPPSSFKDGSSPRTPGPRPGSRTGAVTPSLDGKPLHPYVPANSKDPLDNELATVVNAISHNLLIERVDPPLRTAPREGEEIRAQYAFSNTLARKVVTCKLTTLARSGARGRDTATKKVMCRVGGGWQDLKVYLASR